MNLFYPQGAKSFTTVSLKLSFVLSLIIFSHDLTEKISRLRAGVHGITHDVEIFTRFGKNSKIGFFASPGSNCGSPLKGGRPPVRFFGEKRTDHRNVGEKVPPSP